MSPTLSITWLTRSVTPTGRQKPKQLYRRALDIREKSLGPDHPIFANSLNNLAVLLKDANRPTEAESAFSPGAGHPGKELGP